MVPGFWFRNGSGGGPQLLQNSFTDRFQIFMHIRIEKPDDADIERFEKFSTYLIVFPCLVGKVRITVKFYCQSLQGAIEVHDVAADTVLSAKFEAAEVAALQLVPQLSFSGSCLMAQRSAQRLNFRGVVNGRIRQELTTPGPS